MQCPQCGHKALFDFFTCAECGWEAQGATRPPAPPSSATDLPRPPGAAPAAASTPPDAPPPAPEPLRTGSPPAFPPGTIAPFELRATGGDYFGFLFSRSILVLATCGIYGFWLAGDRKRWLLSRTYVHGEPLRYESQLADFALGWLVSAALLFVTCGLFLPWSMAKKRRYEWRHTTVADGRTCRFDGTGDGLLGALAVASLISLFTCGFGSSWAIAHFTSWSRGRLLIGGERVQFDGTGGELFGLAVGGQLLTLLTCGLYLPWHLVNLERWIASHSRVALGGDRTPVEPDALDRAISSAAQDRRTWYALGGLAGAGLLLLGLYRGAGAVRDRLDSGPDAAASREERSSSPGLAGTRARQEPVPGSSDRREGPLAAAGGWAIGEETVFPGGRPAGAAIQELLALLAAPADEGGSPLSEADLRTLLRDPRARDVYREELQREATPSAPSPPKQQKAGALTKVFLREANVADGAGFLRDHRAELARATERYRVAGKDVVSILKWQSNLGKAAKVEHRLFNVFLGQLLFLDRAHEGALAAGPPAGADLAAHRKKLDRIKANAAKNLAALLRWCKVQRADPLEVKGWWEGMIGFPQFMPGSLRHAADGDGDGRIDLYSNADSIESVASYLDAHGYRKNRKRAIQEYNAGKEWVSGVMLYADTIERRAAALPR